VIKRVLHFNGTFCLVFALENKNVAYGKVPFEDVSELLSVSGPEVDSCRSS
jgi:hypothetical protein